MDDLGGCGVLAVQLRFIERAETAACFERVMP